MHPSVRPLFRFLFLFVAKKILALQGVRNLFLLFFFIIKISWWARKVSFSVGDWLIWSFTIPPPRTWSRPIAHHPSWIKYVTRASLSMKDSSMPFFFFWPISRRIQMELSDLCFECQMGQTVLINRSFNLTIRFLLTKSIIIIIVITFQVALKRIHFRWWSAT
jgi:hypothetical protein